MIVENSIYNSFNTSHMDIQQNMKIYLLLASFILGLALSFPTFQVNLSDIGWDEGNYIYSGYALVNYGRMPVLAWSPLIAFEYAVSLLFVGDSIQWMVKSGAIVRLLNYALIWLAAILCARRLCSSIGVAFVVWALVASSVASKITIVGPDALFASLTGLSLWQMLVYFESKRNRFLVFASLLVGLAALARPEGYIQLFAGFIVILSVQKTKSWQSVLSWLLPALAIIAAYLLTYGVVHGNFNSHLRQRSYFNFEQGQGLAIENPIEGLSVYEQGTREARKLYGTPKENNNSVFLAILKNPTAYRQRVIKVFPSALKTFVEQYDYKAGPFFLSIALLGFFVLLFYKQKRYITFLIAAWLSFLILPVLFSFRSSHFILPSVVIWVLGGVGFEFLASRLGNLKAQQAAFKRYQIILIALFFISGTIGLRFYIHNKTNYYSFKEKSNEDTRIVEVLHNHFKKIHYL